MHKSKLLAVLALIGLVPFAMAPTPTTNRNYSRLPTIEHATDCTAATAFVRHYCYEVDDETTWYCPVAADDGMCAGDDWVAVGGAGTPGPDSITDSMLNVTKSISVSWAAPVTADDIYVKVSAGAITLTSVDCVATGSTTPSALVITVDECDSNATNCVSSGGAPSLSALVTNTPDTTFSDAAIDDDDWIRFDITSVTTTPDYAHCRLEYTF